MSTLSGTMFQPGSFRSGVLGDPAYNDGSLGVAQPGAYRSGSLGSYQQPGAYNSGSLGMPQPHAYNSGSLGCGGGCGGRQPASGLGAVAHFLGFGPSKKLGALGAVSLDLDLMVGMVGVFGVLYFFDKKKGG